MKINLKGKSERGRRIRGRKRGEGEMETAEGA